MKRACSGLSDDCIRLSCLAHNLNLIVQNNLKIWDKPAEYDECIEVLLDDSDDAPNDESEQDECQEVFNEDNEEFEINEETDYDSDDESSN